VSTPAVLRAPNYNSLHPFGTKILLFGSKRRYNTILVLYTYMFNRYVSGGCMICFKSAGSSFT